MGWGRGVGVCCGDYLQRAGESGNLDSLTAGEAHKPIPWAVKREALVALGPQQRGRLMSALAVVSHHGIAGGQRTDSVT